MTPKTYPSPPQAEGRLLPAATVALPTTVSRCKCMPPCGSQISNGTATPSRSRASVSLCTAWCRLRFSWMGCPHG